MPVFTIGLYDDPIHSCVNDKPRFDKRELLVLYSELVKKFKQLYFQFRWPIALNSLFTLRKFFLNFGKFVGVSFPVFPNLFDGFGVFHWISLSHPFAGFFVDEASGSFFVESKPQNPRLVQYLFIGQSKLVGNLGCPQFGVVFLKVFYFFRRPNNLGRTRAVVDTISRFSTPRLATANRANRFRPFRLLMPRKVGVSMRDRAKPWCRLTRINFLYEFLSAKFADELTRRVGVYFSRRHFTPPLPNCNDTYRDYYTTIVYFCVMTLFESRKAMVVNF